MDDSGSGASRQLLVRRLIDKTTLNHEVFESTLSVFTKLKEALHELSSDVEDMIEEQGHEDIDVGYHDKGRFEAQLHFADNILIFSMHSDVFEFNREHRIWENPYIRDDGANSYCGIINIYNFLGDSFKYNRNGDEGYLIGRVFINRDKHFFVEGKRQKELGYANFGKQIVDKEALVTIIETAINYTLDFDLLVPPYDSVKQITAEQINTKIENSKIPTGKRIGYSFNTDDI